MSTQTTALLTLVNLTGEEDAPWVAALRETTSTWASKPMERLADAQIGLEEDPSRYAVIIYQDPPKQLSADLMQGQHPAEALVEWQNFAETLTEIYTRFGDRMVVATPPDSDRTLEALTQRIEEGTGLTLIRPEEPSALLTAEALREEGLGTYLAALQMLTLQRPQHLLQQLEALTLDTGSEKPHLPDVIADFLKFQSSLFQDREEIKSLRAETKSKKSEIRKVSKENSLVIEQLHKTQEDLERQVLKRVELKDKVNQMRRGRDYRKTKIAELEKSLKEGQSERTDLERKLESHSAKITELQTTLKERKQKLAGLRRGRDYRKARVTELSSELRDSEQKIEWLRAERERAEGSIQKLERTCVELDAELRRVKTSRSWKYTKPLRRLNGTD